ncbi:sulfatase-like hydrolase/transferase [Paenibacillus sp. HB172176]|uniref:sulfatase family protein n=1 Tax=Paenibacillus sp. HB172176 TaxID=2493690 RepID=UPI00143C171F|nr:sulfatase-like hydrolase/transferase [Paenibacillus sp. HB172176]
MSAKKPPNILLITSDQQHWNTIGAFNSEIRTPNLDRLAREGTAFRRAYCPNPTCTPSRASILTGMYPSQHGAWSLGTKLSEEVPTVGQELAESGYRTALVGKAHFQPLASTPEYESLEAHPLLHDLEYWREFHGPFYGFERVELARNHANERHVGQHYALWMEEKGLANWRDYFEVEPDNANGNGKGKGWSGHRWHLPEAFHQDAWIADRTNGLMEEYAEEGEPFFLWASFFDPHDPYLAPEPWDTMYDPAELTVPAAVPGEHDRNPPHLRLTQEINPDFSDYEESGKFIHGFRSHVRESGQVAKDLAVYYGMISLMDRYIGKILDKLDKLGLTENTLVVFTTDHGEVCGHHGLVKKGAFHYEDLLRIPFLVRYPGRVPARRVSPALQSLVDLAPTFLRYAGLNVPGRMTGVDQGAVWEGRDSEARDHVLCENRHEPTTVHLKTYVDQRYKLTVYYNRPYGELFDLQEDPKELRNLWDDPDSAPLKTELLQRMLWAELGKEAMPMPRISGA